MSRYSGLWHTRLQLAQGHAGIVVGGWVDPRNDPRERCDTMLRIQEKLGHAMAMLFVNIRAKLWMDAMLLHSTFMDVQGLTRARACPDSSSFFLVEVTML